MSPVKDFRDMGDLVSNPQSSRLSDQRNATVGFKASSLINTQQPGAVRPVASTGTAKVTVASGVHVTTSANPRVSPTSAFNSKLTPTNSVESPRIANSKVTQNSAEVSRLANPKITPESLESPRLKMTHVNLEISNINAQHANNASKGGQIAPLGALGEKENIPVHGKPHRVNLTPISSKVTPVPKYAIAGSPKTNESTNNNEPAKSKYTSSSSADTTKHALKSGLSTSNQTTKLTPPPDVTTVKTSSAKAANLPKPSAAQATVNLAKPSTVQATVNLAKPSAAQATNNLAKPSTAQTTVNLAKSPASQASSSPTGQKTTEKEKDKVTLPNSTATSKTRGKESTSRVAQEVPPVAQFIEIPKDLQPVAKEKEGKDVEQCTRLDAGS